MTSPLLVVVFTLAAFVATSTAGKDSVKNANVDLAEELQKARQDAATARQESAKLRQDLEAIITRENEKLRADAEKLKKEDSKIRKENKKLRRQDEELKRKVHALHQDNSEIKSSLRKVSRQRDQNSTMELQNIVRNSFGFRQMDFVSELKKTINIQIQKYLDDNKICVGGQFTQRLDAWAEEVIKKPKIEFGQTFRRIPTFVAAISTIDCKAKDVSNPYIFVYDFEVTTSSAKIKVAGYDCYKTYVSWIACLWVM